MAVYTVFYGTFVHLPRATPSTTKHELSIHHGALWVSVQDGRIKGFDWSVASEDDLVALMRKHGWSVDGSSGTKVTLVRAREDQNEFFFPGFVDTHIHAPQYPNSGVFGSSTLLDWLNTYTFPLEASFGGSSSEVAPPRAHAAYKQVVQRTLANGTTCASYFATIHVPATNLLATLCHQLGQRALVGRVCMDNPAFCPDYYHDEDAAAGITATKATIAHIHSLPDPDRPTSTPLIQPIITPRFAPTCTPQSMTDLAHLAQSHTPPLHIQTHISENTNEVALVRELFPAHEDYTSVYDAHALLTPRTILAHAVHLTPAEMALVRARGAKVAHCPASNSALGSGICPVRTLLDRGITVGLGTDVSGGYSVSVLEAVRSACLVSRLLPHTSSIESDKNVVLTVEDALYLGTRGGAAVVDMADEIGGFDQGMFFDAQLVRLGGDVESSSSTTASSSSSSSPCKSDLVKKGPVDIFGWEGSVDRVHKWVWNGDDRNVRSVWVRGRLVHSLESELSGAVCTVDERVGKWAEWVIGGLGVLGIVGVFWARRG
ncbi:Metallo-dependent hydrolase [Aspergillus campestris IBT 28561]|uniref:Probable guanine deaminase n=1 Tax=Aspergillus campestris (strain IBT 28561) TaxID=1392248 RepID=A0A2I1D704_ASPC2|nr:Metallo-dependent hydrolase [Aspergillus campestris IBT 28561]PKY05655.1 Metallo-dependent hydrolase [Aspergillus campestris IBT 28561]